MKKYFKYSRTYHLPWSPGTTSDDRILKSVSHFEGQEVIITDKLDGECLHGDTLIETEHGEKKIKDLSSYNGKVLSFDVEKNEEVMMPMTNFIVNDNKKEWFEIELENGKILRVTGEHLVWLPLLMCYRQVKDLIETDTILLKN